eukprot:m.33811 g.33811  ORF g.33811 m.33811 type:complete len:50 (+) comp6475_c1_seq1:1219-1368(+)
MSQAMQSASANIRKYITRTPADENCLQEQQQQLSDKHIVNKFRFFAKRQ